MKPFFRNFLIAGVPPLIFVAQLLVEIYIPDEQKPAFNSEGGPLETMEAIVIACAIPVAAYAAFKLKNPWLKLWMGIAALCSFYVAGEELSWGQWVFHWHTPAEWAAINDQNETNLHNTSTWFDQKPRALLELGVLIGGLIIPATRKWMPSKLPERFREIYPDNIVIVTAAFAVLVKIINAFDKITKHHFFWRGSELTEMYLYYFVLLYCVGRVKDWKRRGLIETSAVAL